MFRRCIIAIAALVAASLPILAQQPDPPGKPYLPEQESYQVFVLGDSLAAGLWSGLMRVGEGEARLSVNGRYKEDSGLARPEYYDWNEALPKILERNRIDIAVVMIGTNDAQDIREGVSRHAFGTLEWSQLYAAQVDRLMQSLKGAGAAIYWVELPPMASPNFDGEIRTIAAIQAERAKAAGVKLVATRQVFATQQGGYTDMGFDDAGEFVRLRSRDGVHFLKLGNNRLAGLILEAIRADIEAAKAKAEVAAAPPAGPPPGGPAFGQAATEGGETVVYLEAPPGQQADPRLAKSDLAGALQIVPLHPNLAELARSASPGSAAAKLFTIGEIPAAKPGRFDDFQMPQ